MLCELGPQTGNRTVGISDMAVSADPTEVLVTYSLGSCVGLSLYDPVARVGGLIHCMLPLSRVDPDKARVQPCMFVDTGVPALLLAVYKLGGGSRNIIAKVAGAATLLDEKQLFRIGRRNHTVLRKLLWKNDILIDAEDVGGSKARTVFLHMDTGQTIVRSGGQETVL